MGQLRQKRKNRSALPRTRQRARKPLTKRILGLNPVLRDNWDAGKTLSQNYARLGLLGRVNKVSGGVERRARALRPRAATRGTEGGAEGGAEEGLDEQLQEQLQEQVQLQEQAVNTLDISSRKSRLSGAGVAASGAERPRAAGAAAPDSAGSDAGMQMQEQRVERDPETGRILRVVAASDAPAASAAEDSEQQRGKGGRRAQATLRDPLRDVLPSPSPSPFASDDDEDDDEERPSTSTSNHPQHLKRQRQQPAPAKHTLTPHAPAGFIGRTTPTHPAASALQAAAARAALHASSLPAQRARRRKQSARERDWVRRLVEKHGPDGVEGMMRDKRLNVMQQSAGDIRRRVRIYLEEEGVGEGRG